MSITPKGGSWRKHEAGRQNEPLTRSPLLRMYSRRRRSVDMAHVLDERIRHHQLDHRFVHFFPIPPRIEATERPAAVGDLRLEILRLAVGADLSWFGVTFSPRVLHHGRSQSTGKSILSLLWHGMINWETSHLQGGTELSTVESFFQYMIGAFLILAGMIGYKAIYRTSWQNLARADHLTGRRTLTSEEINFLDGYYSLPRWRRFLSFVKLW